MRLAGIGALSCVELRYVVVRAVPFQLITEPEVYPVPLTRSVNPAEPAVVELGVKAAIAGPFALTVNVTEFEVKPESEL
jgi:hypothetical protein